MTSVPLLSHVSRTGLAWCLGGLLALSGAIFLGYCTAESGLSLRGGTVGFLGLAGAVFTGTISAIVAGRCLDRRKAREQAVSYIRAVMNTVVSNSVILYAIRWKQFSWLIRLDTQLFDATTHLRFEYLRNQDAIDALGVLHRRCVAINAAFDKAIDTTLADFRAADVTPSDVAPSAANANHVAEQFVKDLVEDLQSMGRTAEKESLECLQLLRKELERFGHVVGTVEVPDFDKPPVKDEMPYRQLW